MLPRMIGRIGDNRLGSLFAVDDRCLGAAGNYVNAENEGSQKQPAFEALRNSSVW